MIRRVKSEVEASLLPKLEYVLKPPLTPLQHEWYRTLYNATQAHTSCGCARTNVHMRTSSSGHPHLFPLTPTPSLPHDGTSCVTSGGPAQAGSTGKRLPQP